ncbi:hypothetical protein MESS4_830410 [Mesorhizobium sp. STM 4661]|nr:hypothetical protein MESS4_830410 [Mesorhizobium sp. STM 4661]
METPHLADLSSLLERLTHTRKLLDHQLWEAARSLSIDRSSPEGRRFACLVDAGATLDAAMLLVAVSNRSVASLGNTGGHWTCTLQPTAPLAGAATKRFRMEHADLSAAVLASLIASLLHSGSLTGPSKPTKGNPSMMTPEQARLRLNGAMTALVTPFSDGEVDLAGLTTLLEWQIEQGINGLVPCGTTGEAPTLSWEERLDVIARCVKVASGRVPIIVGSGTNNTEATIAFTAAAEAFGADAALIVTPYYNKPTQEGIYRHFEAVARKVSIPIIVYNVPAAPASTCFPKRSSAWQKYRPSSASRTQLAI